MVLLISGWCEVVWGQLAAIVSGMKSGMRDNSEKEYLARRPGASGLRQDPAYGTRTLP